MAKYNINQNYFPKIKKGILQWIAHSEGAVVRNDFGQYQHEYVLRDHLGNTRVTFRDGVNKGEPYWDWSNYTYHAPDNTGYDDGTVTKDDIDGNKNRQHANQKAREAAEKRYKEAREQYDERKSQTNKTPEDKKELEQLKKQMNKEKEKMDNTGENHSRKHKGPK